jgi:Undecaprenyl-phosphate galactose phosphotransferase WbaP
MSTAISFDISIAPAPPAQGVVNNCRPLLSIAVMVLADFLVLLTVLLTFTGFGTRLWRHPVQADLIHFWPILPILVLAYWFFDTQPGVSVCQTEEFKRITIANVVASVCLLAGLQISGAPIYPRLTALAVCVAILFAIPIGRYVTRVLGARFAWWGQPVVILGDGNAASSVLRRLQLHPEMGMRPTAIASLHPLESSVGGRPVYSLRQFHKLSLSGIRHAVIAAPELSRAEFAEVLERGRDVFPHIIVIPGLDLFWNTGQQALDFHDFAGISVRNNLLLPRARMAKRLIDLTLCVLAASISVPIIVLISILILLDSGCPIFFSQRRLGRNGKTFRIWKFRTMVKNAEQLKQLHVMRHPERCKEWTENQKLKEDPRITRVGRVLRKTSLDELPQFWNILKGDMSIVGPRPIIHEEVVKYRDSYSLYVKTTPGLTGIWQVSGRNKTTYEERVACDAFYVRNWSVWLDVCVMAKTVLVILTGDGAC